MVYLSSVLKRVVVNHGYRWEFSMKHKNDNNETHDISRHTDSESLVRGWVFLNFPVHPGIHWRLGNTTTNFKRFFICLIFPRHLDTVIIGKTFIHLTNVNKVFCIKYEEDYKICKRPPFRTLKCTWTVDNM